MATKLKTKKQLKKKSTVKQTTTPFSHISVAGFKSICDEQSIEIRPLTVLAGANSTGKSSIMQPLLLMKQTLEAPYDPGAILLKGPNIEITETSQILSRLRSSGGVAKSFTVKFTFSEPEPEEVKELSITFVKIKGKGFKIGNMAYIEDKEIIVKEGMPHKQIFPNLPKDLQRVTDMLSETKQKKPKWRTYRNRCFLGYSLSYRDEPVYSSSPSNLVEPCLRKMIHLAGLRGNPMRLYPATTVGPIFPGRFENYIASIIEKWYEDEDERLNKLNSNLRALGLTSFIKPHRVTDSNVELKVSRLTKSTKITEVDFVNIADVGVGVSQVLPVIVALQAASPGEIVYIEQPEIHLHPKAQVILAEMLASAAKRGVTVIVETHSALLLLGIQTLVARNQNRLPNDLVKLHWFKRTREGITNIYSRDIDKDGTFGNWPQDFGKVLLKAQSDFLNA